MKQIIAEKGIIVASTNAWFQSTYNLETKGCPIIIVNNSILVE
jgi:hypothetical protein